MGMAGHLSGADLRGRSLLQVFSFAGYTPGLRCYSKGKGIWDQFRISLYGLLILEWRGKVRGGEKQETGKINPRKVHCSLCHLDGSITDMSIGTAFPEKRDFQSLV